MGDVDDRNAPRREVADDLEEDVRLGGAQRRCRLVHQQDSRVVDERPGDFDELLLADRERFDECLGIQLLTESAQHVARGLGLCGAVHRSPGSDSFPTEKQVVRYRQVWKELEFLMNDADAAIGRIASRSELDVGTVETKATRRRLFDAGKNLDERRFASPILAN